VTILCLGALLAGLVTASLMPFPPFAFAVMVSIVIGSVATISEGAPVFLTALSAAAILFTSQIGYGLGLLVVGFFHQVLLAARRRGVAKQSTGPVQPLRTGNEPR